MVLDTFVELTLGGIPHDHVNFPCSTPFVEAHYAVDAGDHSNAVLGEAAALDLLTCVDNVPYSHSRFHRGEVWHRGGYCLRLTDAQTAADLALEAYLPRPRCQLHPPRRPLRTQGFLRCQVRAAARVLSCAGLAPLQYLQLNGFRREELGP